MSNSKKKTTASKPETTETAAPHAAASAPAAATQESSLKNVNDVMSRTADVVVARLSAMLPGTKITLKALAQEVTDQTGLSGSNLAPIVSMIVKAYDGVTVEKGRFGGIYKGKRVAVEKKPDARTRCTSCKQVIREKGIPRKKKAKAVETAVDTANVETESPPAPESSEQLAASV